MPPLKLKLEKIFLNVPKLKSQYTANLFEHEDFHYRGSILKSKRTVNEKWINFTN